MITVRPAVSADTDVIWAILEPIVRAGEAYALRRDLDWQQTLVFWMAAGNTVFVAEENGHPLGTYFLRANQKGGGAHVANCEYATATWATGRGVASAMCAHSLEQAKNLGFRAMQFNFVISSNAAAVHLWQKLGFQIVGRLPEAFLHPNLGYVDAFVMHRFL